MKLILFISTLFISTFSYSQDRVNPEKKLAMSNFFVWQKIINGYDFDAGKDKWVNRKNYLDYEGDSIIKLCEDYKQFKEAKSRTEQNFIEIGVIKVKYENLDYIGIAFTKFTGEYKYPSIHEDWQISTENHIYLYPLSKINKLNDFDGEEVRLPTYLRIVGYSGNFKDCYDDLNYVLKNKESYEKEDSNYSEMYFTKAKSNGKNVVRFLLPQSLYPITSSLYQYKKRIDFEKHYFEVSIEEFNKLLQLIK